MRQINEGRIHRKMLDPQLERAGWYLRNHAKVKIKIPVDGYAAEPWNGVTDHVRLRKSGDNACFLRAVLVEAAQIAVNMNPHWKAELARLEPRLGRNKAIVAIARKLLVSVWYILSKQEADRFAEPAAVAQKMLRFAYEVGKENRDGKTAAQFAHQRLDALGMGRELTSIPWGSKKPIPLPPSTLKKRCPATKGSVEGESAVPNK